MGVAARLTADPRVRYSPAARVVPGAGCRGTRELPADRDVRSFVHVDDAAGAAADALAWPAGFVNVCDDVPAPGREWVPAFGRAVGVVAKPVI